MPFITSKELKAKLQVNWKIGFNTGFRTALLGESAYYEAVLPKAIQGMGTHLMDLGLSANEAQEALKLFIYESYLNEDELSKVLLNVIFQRYLSFSNSSKTKSEKIAKIKDEVDIAIQKLPIL